MNYKSIIALLCMFTVCLETSAQEYKPLRRSYRPMVASHILSTAVIATLLFAQHVLKPARKIDKKLRKKALEKKQEVGESLEEKQSDSVETTPDISVSEILRDEDFPRATALTVLAVDAFLVYLGALKCKQRDWETSTMAWFGRALDVGTFLYFMYAIARVIGGKHQMPQKK